MVEAMVVRENSTPMALVAFLAPIFIWHYLTLYCMAIIEVSLIVVEADWLLNATNVVSLAISQSSGGDVQ